MKNQAFNSPNQINAETRASAMHAAARNGLHVLMGNPNSRVLATEEICPSKSRVIDEIRAKLALRCGLK